MPSIRCCWLRTQAAWRLGWRGWVAWSGKAPALGGGGGAGRERESRGRERRAGGGVVVGAFFNRHRVGGAGGRGGGGGVVVGAKRGGLVCTLTWPARSPSRQAHRGAGEARRGRFVHPPGDKDGAAAAATAAATSTRGGTRPRTGDSNQQWRATHRRQVPARDANTIGTGAGVVAPLCSAGQPAIR